MRLALLAPVLRLGGCSRRPALFPGNPIQVHYDGPTSAESATRRRPMPLDEAVAELLATMSKSPSLVFAAAVRPLGGELRIDPRRLLKNMEEPTPHATADASDGPLVIRLTG